MNPKRHQARSIEWAHRLCHRLRAALRMGNRQAALPHPSLPGWLVLAPPAKGLWWLAGKIQNGASAGLLLLFFIVDEWWRGPRAEETAESEEWSYDGQAEENEQTPYDEQAAYEARYAAALARFGLGPEFTRAELDRAYKRANRTAHPDAGGSVAEAQAVNADRDLLIDAHGST